MCIYSKLTSHLLPNIILKFYYIFNQMTIILLIAPTNVTFNYSNISSCCQQFLINELLLRESRGVKTSCVYMGKGFTVFSSSYIDYEKLLGKVFYSFLIELLFDVMSQFLRRANSEHFTLALVLKTMELLRIASFFRNPLSNSSRSP